MLKRFLIDMAILGIAIGVLQPLLEPTIGEIASFAVTCGGAVALLFLLDWRWPRRGLFSAAEVPPEEQRDEEE